MSISLQPTLAWIKGTHEPHLRRSQPNEVYSSRKETVMRVLSRIEYLREIRVETGSTLPAFEPDVMPEQFTVVNRRSSIDECDIYTSSTGYRFAETFHAGDDVFTLEKSKNMTDVYVGVMSTSDSEQVFMVAKVDIVKNKLTAGEVIIYKDNEATQAVTTFLRDISSLPSYRSDAIRFFEGTTVTPEDLNWHYTELSRIFDSETTWTGVKFPLRVSDYDDRDDTFVETRILRPYVHMSMKYAAPKPVDGKLILFVDTKHGVGSVHCEFPTEATSIGMPALGDNSGLIVRFHCVDSALTQVDVLAYNFPFWTPLSGALPVEALPSLPAIDDFDDDFLSFIGDAIKRQERKKWIDGELEEHPPSYAKLQSAVLPFNDLSSFSLYKGKKEFTWSSIESNNRTALLLRQVSGPRLRTKKKCRLVVAYVFDGVAHKHRLKFKTSNFDVDSLAYVFDLPGPIRLHLELTDAGQHHYAVAAIHIDTLAQKIVSIDDDDEAWLRLLSFKA